MHPENFERIENQESSVEAMAGRSSSWLDNLILKAIDHPYLATGAFGLVFIAAEGDKDIGMTLTGLGTTLTGLGVMALIRRGLTRLEHRN